MDILTLNIELDNADANAVAVIAKMKFNKLGFVSQEWDDSNYTGANNGKTLWSTYTFTDGCSNLINYAGAIALNRGTGNPSDEGYNPNMVQVPELRSLTSAGFDVENHSFYHTNIKPLDQSVLLDGIIDLRMGYKMRVLVIPENFVGFTHSAKLMKYIASSGQGAETFDEYTPGVTTLPIDEVTDPIFFGVSRSFLDDWNIATEINNLKNKVNNILNGVENILVIGTHNPLSDPAYLNGFTDFYNYVRDTSNDRLLVCSTREVLEYLEMRTMPITQSVNGNVLTIEIDITNLSNRNRWRDLSFNIQTTSTITNVTTNGFTSSSFNPTTKLVNGFLQKDTWSGIVTRQPFYIPAANYFINNSSSGGFSRELNTEEQWASQVYYAIDSIKYNTDQPAVHNDSVGRFIEKKQGDYPLIFRGNAVTDIFGRPPYLLIDPSNSMGFTTFWNSPNLGFTTDDFRKINNDYDYQYYSTGATLIMMRLPGQSDEAAINDFGGRFYVSEINGDFRVGPARGDNSQRVITGSNVLPTMFQICSIHVEYIANGNIGLWINNVFKGSTPNDIPEGTGGYGDIAKLRNALGVFTNSMSFRFYAYYIHNTTSFANIVANRNTFLTSIGNKFHVGEYDSLPHPNNDIELTYNTVNNRFELTFTASNATQSQIDNAEIRWYILTPAPNNGAFTPQNYIKTGKYLNRSDFQQIYNDHFAVPRPEHFWASAFIKLEGALDYIQSPYKSIYAPYNQ